MQAAGVLSTERALDRDAVLRAIVRLGRAPKVVRLASYLRDSEPGVDELLDDTLVELAESRCVEFWGTELADVRVCLTPLMAERLGIELDDKGRRWQSRKRDIRGYRVNRGPLMLSYEEACIEQSAKHKKKYTDADLFAQFDPPLDLDSLQRTTIGIVGPGPWPVPFQNRAPYGPHVMPPENYPRKIPRYDGKCGVCGNKIHRPYACLACDRPRMAYGLTTPPDPTPEQERARIGRYYLKAKVKPGLKGGTGS
jgi:hypothetical protein